VSMSSLLPSSKPCGKLALVGMNDLGLLDLKDNSTILLAEDNEDDVVLIRAAFEQAGLPYRFEVVRNGQEAIACLKGEGAYADRSLHPVPFMLLLDLKMPLKTGFDVLEWIRTKPDLDRLLVVVLSGSQLPADMGQAERLGTNSYLVKSADYQQLILFLKSFAPE